MGKGGFGEPIWCNGPTLQSSLVNLIEEEENHGDEGKEDEDENDKDVDFVELFSNDEGEND